MKTVAIVGANEYTRHLAPWDNPNIDIWVFNEWANHDWCKRWDAVLQLHKPEIYQRLDNDKDPGHWAWLQQDHGKPVYMQEVDPDVPNSVRYPLEEINAEYLSTLTYKGIPVNNLGCTASLAVALALYQGYERIEVYGIEMAHSSEYRSQRANFSFWVGVATGRGVQVDLFCTHGLFHAPIYGYETDMDKDKLYEYIKGMKQQQAEAEKQVAMLEGAIQFARQLILDEDEPEEDSKDEES